MPVSCKLPEDTDFFTRYVTSGHKPQPEQIPDPFGIFGIVLVPLDSLYPFWIGDGDVELVFQKVEHGYPVFAGRFHTNVTAGFTVQNKKSQIVLNTSINSSSYVSFSILPMIYQYFWRVRLAKNKPE